MARIGQSIMNEQFKQLSLEAGGSHYPTINPQMQQRFGELIVEKCIAICNKIYFERYPDAEDFERSEEGDAIKKHFGVEEPKGWICPKCNADRTKIACPLGFGATVDGRCPMVVTAQGVQE